jgi:hypothetical protein
VTRASLPAIPRTLHTSTFSCTTIQQSEREQKREAAGVGGFVDDSPCRQLIQTFNALVRCDIWFSLLTGTHGLDKDYSVHPVHLPAPTTAQALFFAPYYQTYHRH